MHLSHLLWKSAVHYTQFVKSEIDLWTRVIKAAGIKAE